MQYIRDNMTKILCCIDVSFLMNDVMDFIFPVKLDVYNSFFHYYENILPIKCS